MSNWLVFANKERCNHAKALQELGYISWRQDRVRFAVGDIVYLFMSDERCVRFKTIVTAADQERGDGTYWNGVAPKDKTFKLELVEEYNGDALGETKLLEHGFHGGRKWFKGWDTMPEEQKALFEALAASRSGEHTGGKKKKN